MKKVKKLILSLALMFGFTFFAPTIAGFKTIAQANMISSAYYIQVKDFKTKAEIGAEYQVAVGEVKNLSDDSLVANATVEVYSPFGKKLTVNAGKVLVENFGRYTVKYSYDTLEYTLKFNAEEGQYSFKFEENAAQIIPSIMNVNFAGNIVLPNPTVIGEDGEEVSTGTVEIAVTKPNYEAATLLTEGGYKAVKVNEVGIWTVKYQYKVDGRIVASTTKEIIANDTYNNTYALNFTTSSTFPTTAVTKVETLLPAVSAKDPSENQVSVRLSIKAEKVNYDDKGVELAQKTDVTTSSMDGRKFTPQEDGNYYITYTVTDAFGNSKVQGFYILGVKDTKAPEVKVVNPYTGTPTDLTDASYKIPSKANLKNFVLPAIWAEDNVDTTELVLTRKITKYGDVIYSSTEHANKELVFNKEAGFVLDEDTQVVATLNEGVSMTAGPYYVTYIAKDKAGNEKTSASFQVILEDGFNDSQAPEITWSKTEVLPAEVRLGEKVTFSAPTVEDEHQKRHNLTVEYAYFDGANLTAWTPIELSEAGLYEVEVLDEEQVGYTELRIRAIAKDAFGTTVLDADAIQILNTIDNVPVKFVSFASNNAQTFKQGDEILLGDVVIEDDLIGQVSLNVTASVEVDGKAQSINVYDANTTVAGNTLTISDAKMLASFGGTYTITYVAKDIKNNYAIYSYEVEVASFDEQIDIDFAGLPTILNGNGELELGDKIKLPTATIVAPTGADVSQGYTVSVINGPMAYRIDSREFEPYAVGTYKIQYKAVVEYNSATEEITKEFTVKVKDTTAPTIQNLELADKLPINSELIIPMVAAIDNKGFGEINWEESKVVLTRKSNNSTSTVRTIVLSELEENIKVTLSYNEVYTLTYTIKDMAGNVATLTKSIKVGDTDAPVITVDESKKDFVPTTASIGDRLVLDLSKLSVSDLVDKNLTVSDIEIVLRRDGEIIENIHGDSKENYEFKLDKAGQYTLTLKVTDAAGNTSTAITRTITVSADANDGVDTTEVLGIVLIVVSALILAGAIVYVVLSKKKADQYKG